MASFSDAFIKPAAESPLATAVAPANGNKRPIIIGVTVAVVVALVIAAGLLMHRMGRRGRRNRAHNHAQQHVQDLLRQQPK